MRLPTRSASGWCAGDLVLQILAYVAQKEREFICSRTMEGIAAAKARGVRFGRPSLQVPESFETVYTDWSQSKISAREAARKLGVDHKTFGKWCQAKTQR